MYVLRTIKSIPDCLTVYAGKVPTACVACAAARLHLVAEYGSSF